MQNQWLRKYFIGGLCLLMLGAALSGGRPSLAQDTPAVQKIESDDARVLQTGTWHSQSAPAASGGSYLYNDPSSVGAGLRSAQNNGSPTPEGASEPRPYASALVLQFSGPSLEVIYVSGPTLGTLAIEIDGTVLRTVITTDSETRYGQVAKIDYLTDEAHELKVYAQGGGVIAVDAFVIANVGEATAERDFTAVSDPTENSPRVPFCDPIETLHRASLINGGFGQGNAESLYPSLSRDGRYVVFTSAANNLVAGDTNGRQDIFVRDQQTCETRRVSVASNGLQGDADSPIGLVSDDGRYAVFESLATTLVPNDTNGAKDIFVNDRQTGETTRLSIGTDGTQPNQSSYLQDISGDARFVLFVTNASNLDPSDTENDDDFYIRDRQLGTTTRVTAPRLDTTASGQISDDGRYLAFASSLFRPNNDVYYCIFNACSEVYWHDRQTNTTVQISRTNSGGAPVGGRHGSGGTVISADGRFVAFHSDRSNLGDGGAGGTICTYTTTIYFGFPITVYPPCGQVYVFDSLTQQNTRLTLAPSGHQAQTPNISADGRYISYEVHELDIYGVTHDHDGYLFDRITGIATPVGYETGANYFVRMSTDGRFVSFYSPSPGLVQGDTNAVADIFVSPTGTAPPGDKLALFRNDTNSVSLLNTLQTNPPQAAYHSFTITPDPDGQNGRWVMGDWDGDGDKTPGTYANGAFFFTNDITPNPTWLSVWIGLIDRPPVVGRFDSGVNHDCVGAVDSAEFPPHGTAFALYFTCDLTNETAPPLTFQWLSVVLPDSGGFSGTHQFAAGDFNNDGVDSLAIRRGEFIAFGNVPPTTLLSEFNLAQYWGVPPVTDGDYGIFLAGDFDNATGDSFGVHYQNGNFYYRNAVDWYPGPHTLQQVGQPIGTPVQATSWR